MQISDQDLIDVKVNVGLQGLKPLLKEWTTVVVESCEGNSDEMDNPWWYNERATLSTLAGAAWRLNGWKALEEFCTTKHGVIPKKKAAKAGAGGETKKGRCDLYISHASTGFAMEAKQAWQSIGRKAKSTFASKGMKLAWNDVGKLTAEEADIRLALTFVVPYLPLSQLKVPRSGSQAFRSEVRAKVTKWLDEFVRVKDKEIHAYAHVFPWQSEGFLSSTNKNMFPGVLLLLRERKKAKKATN